MENYIVIIQLKS